MEQGSFTSFDGTRLAGFRAGEKGRPALVLANGLGGDVEAWRHLIDQLQDRYHILSWDYRGLFRSDIPKDPSSYTVKTHCLDLATLLKQEEINSFVIAGWSMGVQVCLEHYRLFPKQVKGLILVCGTYGRPFETAFHAKIPRFILEELTRFFHKQHKLVEYVMRKMLHQIDVVRWGKALGFLAHQTEERVVRKVVDNFISTLNMEVYFQILDALSKHDAEEILEKIEVPTLIVAGTKDFFTPMSLAEEMHQRIQGSELVIVPGGSHYAPVEYPEVINPAVENFLSKNRL